MASGAYQYDVFLSYDRADADWVRRLAARIRAEHRDGNPFKVFLDEDAIGPGQHIPSALEQALQSSRKVVVVVSPDAIESKWVTLERFASLMLDPLNLGSRVVPILLRGSERDIPLFLQQFKYLDFRQEAFDGPRFRDLISVLKDERSCGDVVPPESPRVTYLKAFLDRKRSPAWDPYLESTDVIATAKFPIADVPFELHASALDQSLTLENVGRTRAVRVPRFVNQLLIRAGAGPARRKRRDKEAQVFIFLGAPASGKSSLMIQIARWIAGEAESDSQFPIPVYVNLTHFGAGFEVTDEGLARLIRRSIRQACPRYLSSDLPIENPIGEEIARALTLPDSPHKVLFIFDGLDEVPADGDLAGEHKRRIETIAALIDARPQQVFLVTCRLQDYVALRSYRNHFSIAVQAIRPWTSALFRTYVRSRTKKWHDPRMLGRLIATAGNAETWGPLANTPLLGAMFLAWPSSKGTPTAGELWDEFIAIRLGPHVEGPAYDSCVSWLKKLGMALTVKPDKKVTISPPDVHAARKAGLLADADGISANPKFVITPLQHYFAAKYMLGEIRRRPTAATFQLSHQRFRYATHLLIETGGTDPRLLQHLAEYLKSWRDPHEAARRFEACARSLTASQLDASDELEDALVVIVERVLSEGDGGDVLTLMDGIKTLPELLSRRRTRATLLLDGVAAIGTALTRRRVLQVAIRSPRVFLANPIPFVKVLAAFGNEGVLGRELGVIFESLPASSQTARLISRAAGRTVWIVSHVGFVCCLYATYLAGVVAANWLASATAAVFGVAWPYDRSVPIMPRDGRDLVIRLAFLSVATVLPWLFVARSRRAGFGGMSLLSRALTVAGGSVLLRYLFLLPILGILVVTTIPSGLEFILTMALFVAPLAGVASGVWLGRDGGARTRIVARDADDAYEAELSRIELGFPGVGADSDESDSSSGRRTRSTIIKWYSRYLERVRAARGAVASVGRKWWISAAVAAGIIMSLLWAHGLAWFGLFLLLVTGLAVWFEVGLFRHYRECKRTLAEIRSRLATMMRAQGSDSAVGTLLDAITDARRPLFIRKKYLQFLGSEVQWDLPLLDHVRRRLETAAAPPDIKSYLEIMIALKTREAEMRELPRLTDAELTALFEGDDGDGPDEPPTAH